MKIIVKNNTLSYDDFIFKCSIGKNGVSSNKVEGDKKTPKGLYSLNSLYFRKDRVSKPITLLQSIPIKKNMGWCDDVKSKFYNKIVDTKKRLRHEKLFINKNDYDLLIPISYNTTKIKKGKGSAIFLHLTKNYKKTLGCIAIKKKDMIILLKIITKQTKIEIT
jgi:L,D-peptidoglycan transpeptidase YkuD (ErfK/YbiS/YcfS/YnhG family)